MNEIGTKPMTAFAKNIRESLSVGLSRIDEEHQKLFDCVDALMLSVNTKNGVSKSIEILGSLVIYANTHFRSEEELMRLHRYPLIEIHTREHQSFSAQIDQFKLKIEQSDISQSMTAYLIDWLIGHIRSSDAKLAKHIRAGTMAGSEDSPNQ